MPDSSGRTPLTPRTSLLALSLTTTAGYVDSVGYLALAHIYTANMTGNSVALGRHMVEHNWLDMGRRGLPIAAFFLGLVAGAAIHSVACRRRLRRAISVMLFLEWLLLVGYTLTAFALHPDPKVDPTAAAFILMATFAALAMGIQNASLRKAGALTVHTTHVTGLLLECADATVRVVEAFASKTCPRPVRPAIAVRDAAFLFSLWILYVGRAIAAVILLQPLGAAALIPVMCLLVAWILVDIGAPFTV